MTHRVDSFGPNLWIAYEFTDGDRATLYSAWSGRLRPEEKNLDSGRYARFSREDFGDGVDIYYKDNIDRHFDGVMLPWIEEHTSGRWSFKARGGGGYADTVLTFSFESPADKVKFKLVFG